MYICGNANTHVFTYYHENGGAEQSLDIIVCGGGGRGGGGGILGRPPNFGDTQAKV